MNDIFSSFIRPLAATTLSIVLIAWMLQDMESRGFSAIWSIPPILLGGFAWLFTGTLDAFLIGLVTVLCWGLVAPRTGFGVGDPLAAATVFLAVGWLDPFVMPIIIAAASLLAVPFVLTGRTKYNPEAGKDLYPFVMPLGAVTIAAVVLFGVAGRGVL